MTPENALATLAWLLLVAGWAARRRRRVHLSLVVPGIVIDLGLVVALEVGRGVVDRSVSVEHTLPQQVHIASSLLAVLLYLPTIAFGVAILLGRGGGAARGWHRRSAVAALLARTIGFLFMWSL